MPAPSDGPSDLPLRVAVHLLEAERLSLGRAAELAGTSVRGLMDEMGFGALPMVEVAHQEAEPMPAPMPA